MEWNFLTTFSDRKIEIDGSKKKNGVKLSLNLLESKIK